MYNKHVTTLSSSASPHINRTIIPGPVLVFPLCVKSKCPCLINYVWWIERHLFLISCRGLARAALQRPLEAAVCRILNRVNSALSAVLFAFPQSPSSKGGMLVDRKEASQPESWRKVCIVGMLLVPDIYLNVLPANQQILTLKTGLRVSCELSFDFSLSN